MEVFWSVGSTEGWRELSSTTGSASLSRRDIFAEDEIWTKPEYYSTIQYADIDGDGRAELLARGPDGMIAYQWNRDSNRWTMLPAGPALNDAGNWCRPEYYTHSVCRYRRRRRR